METKASCMTRRPPIPSDYIHGNRFLMADQSESLDAALEPHTVPLNDGTRETTVWICPECGRKSDKPPLCEKCSREELTEQAPRDPYMEGGE